MANISVQNSEMFRACVTNSRNVETEGDHFLGVDPKNFIIFSVLATNRY